MAYTETFTGSNGAAWPAAWTTSSSAGTGTNDIQGNKGRMLTAATPNYNVCRAELGTAQHNEADTIVAGTAQVPSGNKGQANIFLRSNNTWSGDITTNNYFAQLNLSGDSLMMFKTVGGSVTQLGSTVAFAFAVGTTYAFKFQAIGSAIKFKVWDASGSEPGTWQIEATDTAHTGAGQVLLAYRNLTGGDARSILWDDIDVSNGVVAPPATPWLQVVGASNLSVIGGKSLKILNGNDEWETIVDAVEGGGGGGSMSFTDYKASVIDEMQGFAKYGGVTGGQSGSLYTVTTTANSGAGSLRDALSASNRWIVFDRTVFPKNTETTINLTSPIDMRNINNVTVDGFGARVRITGFGITTAAWTTTGATSISNNLCFINLKINGISAGNYDCLTIDGTDRWWLYHCDLSQGGDGNLDVTHVHAGPNNPGYGTIQNCYIHESQSGKGCLLGNQTQGQGDYVSASSSHPSGNGGDCKITIWRSRFKDAHRNPIVANYHVHTVNSWVHGWTDEGFAIMGLNGHLRVENCSIDARDAVANPTRGIFAWTFSYTDDSRKYKRWLNTGNVFLGGATELNAAGSYLNPSGSIFTVPYSYSAESVTGDSAAALMASLGNATLTHQNRAGCVDRDGYFDLVIGGSGGGGGGGGDTTFTPTVISLSSTEITNPWHGQYIWNNNAPRPVGWPVTDTYARPAWRNLETTQGNYNFASIESLCADAQSRGGRATLGIFSLYYGGGASWYRAVPDYIADNPAAGTFVNSYFIPNWNSEAYLSRWEALMAAIADDFGDDVRFGGIDVRGYGNYGEWHEYDSPDMGGITEANAKRLVDATLDNFLGTNTRIFMLSAHVVAMEYALLQSPDIGIRADSLGANEIGGATWFMDRVAERGLVNPYTRWQVAPFITEWPHFTNSDLFPVGHQQVQTYHISHLSSGNIHSSQPTTNSDFENANKKSGARIVLASVNLPGTVVNGTPFSVTSEWYNVNYAPPYDLFNVNFELRSGATVVWTGTSLLDMRTLLPTTDTAHVVNDTFTVTGVTPGNYTLHVKIPWQDNGGYLPPYNLAITGKTADGAYPLGTIAVTN